MPDTYWFSTEGEDTQTIRFKNADKSDDLGYDIMNMLPDGSFLLRHIGNPQWLQDASATTNAGTSVSPVLGATAIAGNLLLVSVLVDETPGTRTITAPAGYSSIGGNTISGSMRLNSYIKIADGTETGVTVTVSGSTEIIAVLTELTGFNGFVYRDSAESDTGTSTTPTMDVAAAVDEMVSLYFGMVGSRLASHSSPTNDYVQQESVATTSMRLSTYTKSVGDASDPDFAITLGSSQAWIARDVIVSPSRLMFNVPAGSDQVFLNNVRLPRQEDVPKNPVNNSALLYVREDPDSAGNQQPMWMHDDGEMHEVAWGTQGGPKWFHGTGTPEAVVTAPPGSVFMRTDGAAGTTLYVKTSGTGNTGWTAK